MWVNRRWSALVLTGLLAFLACTSLLGQGTAFAFATAPPVNFAPSLISGADVSLGAGVSIDAAGSAAALGTPEIATAGAAAGPAGAVAALGLGIGYYGTKAVMKWTGWGPGGLTAEQPTGGNTGPGQPGTGTLAAGWHWLTSGYPTGSPNACPASVSPNNFNAAFCIDGPAGVNSLGMAYDGTSNYGSQGSCCQLGRTTNNGTGFLVSLSGNYTSFDGLALWLPTSDDTYQKALADPNVQWIVRTGTLYAAPPPAPAPTHDLKMTQQCLDAAGNMTSTTSISAPFKEADPITPQFTWEPCPAGSHGVGVAAVEEKLDPATGLTVGTAKPLVSWAPPATSPVRSASYVNADCAAGSGSTPCKLMLYKLDATRGQVACDANIVDCSEYVTGFAPASPSTYECHWGAHVVAVSECDMFRGTFKAPDTTGQGSPTDTTAPAISPGSSCMPHGWGLFNPIEWVYKPVICAGRDLFIPSGAQVADWQSLQSNISGRAPFSTVTDAGAFIAGTFGGSGDGSCLDFATDLGPLGHVHAFNTCDTTGLIGLLRSYRPLVETAMFAALLAPLMWWAWKTYAPAANSG